MSKNAPDDHSPDDHLVAFWLVPAARDHARLRRMIDALADEFDAPPFEPHVTLHVGRGVSAHVEAPFRRIAASIRPFELTAAATGHGADRFKAVFIEFEQDPRPLALHEALQDAMATPAEYCLMPHLSLIYQVLPEPTRRGIATRNTLLGQSIAFDHLAAVRPGRSDDSWDDVLGLDIWLRAPLGGR
jgi:2'-5' RNA ligase